MARAAAVGSFFSHHIPAPSCSSSSSSTTTTIRCALASSLSFSSSVPLPAQVFIIPSSAKKTPRNNNGTASLSSAETFSSRNSLLLLVPKSSLLLTDSISSPSSSPSSSSSSSSSPCVAYSGFAALHLSTNFTQLRGMRKLFSGRQAQGTIVSIYALSAESFIIIWRRDLSCCSPNLSGSLSLHRERERDRAACFANCVLHLEDLCVLLLCVCRVSRGRQLWRMLLVEIQWWRNQGRREEPQGRSLHRTKSFSDFGSCLTVSPLGKTWMLTLFLLKMLTRCTIFVGSKISFLWSVWCFFEDFFSGALLSSFPVSIGITVWRWNAWCFFVWN